MDTHAGVSNGEATSESESATSSTAINASCAPLHSESEDPCAAGARSLNLFKESGDMAHLEQAISLLEIGVQVTTPTPDDPNKADYLTNLAHSLYTRFQRLGELSDLEQAISRYTAAVELTSDSHPNKYSLLSSLTNSLNIHFERLGAPSDLERSIVRQREAMRLIPDDHPDKAGYQHKLGNTLLNHFRVVGEIGDLAESISRHRDAVQLTPDNHPDKLARLNDLGGSLGTRYQRLGELVDAKESIAKIEEAVQLTPKGHPDRARFLSNLGISLGSGFSHSGELGYLEQAISSWSEAVELTPAGDPSRIARLHALGNCLATRFTRLGRLDDLEQAIARQSEAVELTPNGDPEKATRLNHLGYSFLTRFARLDKLSDLETAISMQNRAVELTPDEHPAKASYLTNLGLSYTARSARLHELKDLEQAISKHQKAVQLTPDGHRDRPQRLSYLSVAFGSRFVRLGDLSALEQSILRQKEAIQLTPDSHPAKPQQFTILANFLHDRFKRLGELDDLEQSISVVMEAMRLKSLAHVTLNPLCFGTLGRSLLSRFQRFDQLADLEQAVLAFKEAEILTPDDGASKPRAMSESASALLARYIRLGERSDLEESISKRKEAIRLTPGGSPSPSDLTDLSTSLSHRFQCLGELDDLHQSISGHKKALEMIPAGHQHQFVCRSNLADALVIRLRHLGDKDDLEDAILQYSIAACDSAGPSTSRFHSSQRWISLARSVGHHTLLKAYSTAIELLPQLAWIGFTLTHRYQELMRGADVVREAAAAALELGRPELAVEWLEQGRSVVWGELFQLRSSFDELSSVHPDLARRLRQLSTELEHTDTHHDDSLTLMTRGGALRSEQSIQHEADRRRALAISRDQLLQNIRRLPGFERFLLHREFPQLTTAAHSGPVVVLSAAERRCDALIILADAEDVIHVPLPDFTIKRTWGLQNSMDGLLGHARVITSDDRAGRIAPRRKFSWEFVLSSLWKGVVKPVLDALAFSSPGQLSRLFWCPTGPFTFLPIHAAGLYGTQYLEPGHKIFDFVISSYVPTLSTLISPPALEASSNGDFRILAVPQPPSDGQFRLPGVHTELEYVKAVISDAQSARVTLLESSEGTVEQVLELMKDADWVHFACHGVQDPERPTDSGLCLANGRRLKLSDMISLSRPRGGLAFLSACQTAMGDKNLSDEAVHVAAGMLFAGYGGVIGTMWSISDRVAPRVARDVYEQLFGTGSKPDWREAARALHEAVGRLRDGGGSFVEWLPFIHVGV